MAINKNTYLSDTGTGGKKKPTNRDTASLDAINAQNAYDALQLAEYQRNPQQLPLPDKDDTGDSGDGGGYGGGYYASAPETADWMQYATPGSALTTDLASRNYEYDKAPEYVDPYRQQIDALAQQIINRPAFAYDYKSDPNYQQYAKSYGDAGRRAMQDTLAQISARTGGIASSYAGSASQQAYNNYMARLADKVPELRQAAYDMYLDEGNTMRNNLSMLQSLEGTDYGMYQDRLGQFNTDRNLQLSLDQLADERAQAEQDAIRDRVGSYLSLGGSLSGLDPALITGSGLTAAELAAIENSYAQPVYYGGGGGGGGDEDAADDYGSILSGMTDKQILDLYLKGNDGINNSPMMQQYMYEQWGIVPSGTDAGTAPPDYPRFQNEVEAKNWLVENGAPSSALRDSRTKYGIKNERDWLHDKSVNPSSEDAVYDYYEDYVSDRAAYIATVFGIDPEEAKSKSKK